MARLAQINVGRSRPAQDLIAKISETMLLGLVAISEPSRIPENDRWVSSTDRPASAAITWQWSRLKVPCSPRWRGKRFVAVDWGEIIVVSCYFPPSLRPDEFMRDLKELEVRLLEATGQPVIVVGDFNARSHAWDSGHPNRRGCLLMEWIAVMNLQIINDGLIPTCIHPRGTSCVDLTLASTLVARRVVAWTVASNTESLSDHRYVITSIGSSLIGPQIGRTAMRTFPRWVTTRLNRDIMEAAAIFYEWSNSSESVNADRINRIMRDIADISMPRRGPRKRPSVYWWNEEISSLRRECNRRRRLLTRGRARGNVSPDAVRELWDDLRVARRDLRKAINRSKAKLWGELVDDLDRDPWGTPYRVVLKKLYAGGAQVVEMLPPETVKGIVSTLFPVVRPPLVQSVPIEWSEEMKVSTVEILEAGARIKTGKAPGPDGIAGSIIKNSLEYLAPLWARCFTECLRGGYFPQEWKKARLVLVKKPNKPDFSPSSYRPICLLSEAGKLFERVLAGRLQEHLDQSDGLAGGQFGFRRHRSTVDAIWHLRELIEEGLRDGGVVLAVSLDIANAFNSLPWPVINVALANKEVPLYLRNVFRDYLSNRSLAYIDRRDRLVRMPMTCGVPQGSVLGPTLWNVGYDSVLRQHLPIGCSVLCYADDTLLVARASDFEESRFRAEVGATYLVRYIESLGLRVSIAKTEAVAFTGGRIPENAYIGGGAGVVPIGSAVRYLGLILDSRWTFRDHFRSLMPKAWNMATALARITANIGGPGEKRRRMYASVVMSVILYGAPIWAQTVVGNRKIVKEVDKLLRQLALRVIRGYRTVSYDAGAILSGMVPFELAADRLRRSYIKRREIISRDGAISPRASAILGEVERRRSVARWRDRLAGLPLHGPGALIRGAFVEDLELWMGRAHGALTYRITQILTGHGVFEAYLFRIERRDSPICVYCRAAQDTSVHTLLFCPFWAEQREELLGLIGNNRTLKAVVSAIVRSSEAWGVFANTCENIMRRKEEDERAWERGLIPQLGEPVLPVMDDVDDE